MKEVKIITIGVQIHEEDPHSLKLACRDWLLGGETYNWKQYIDLKTGDIILERW